MTSPWQFDQNSAAAPSAALPAHPQGPGQSANDSNDSKESGWDAARGDVIAGGIVFGTCLLLGVAAGALWYAIAPDIPKIIVDHLEYLRPSAPPEAEIARDGWFALIGSVVGLVLAILAFWKGRKYGIGVAIGLGAGGMLGSYIAYKVGGALGPDTFGEQLLARDGRIEFEEPLRIQAKGVLYLWPMASVILFLCLTAGFGPRDRTPKGFPWPPQQQGQMQPHAQSQMPYAAPPTPGTAPGSAAGPDLTKRSD
ncbi:hypothetical protein [Streptodolium elevatio]|uniref:DUF2567 domain-containing protein n=1 Tax=Streptodolium elevatio TaxID=3157996 RepID=A0ABV3DHR6_9ACTN